VLTWCGYGVLASSALAAVRWWLRRRDALGRSRAFPIVTVGVLALAGSLLLVPGFRRAQLEHRLSRVASQLVGTHVEVHCETTGEEFLDVGDHLGYVRFDADGIPEHRTTLRGQVCSALSDYFGSDHARPSQDEVQAVHVLSHESRHLGGIGDEALAECQAMQQDARAAHLLGATSAEAAALARSYWSAFYPLMPADYRSSDCAPGGAWDEHLPDAPWSVPLTP
jgi:uncharacterized membrane protein